MGSGLRHIYVAAGGELTICDCTAKTDKDGNYTAGKLTGADGTAGGGSIRLAPAAVVNQYGGKITGNQSGGEGFAVYLADSGCDGHSYFAGVMKMSGNMKIHDNTGGDLFLGQKVSMILAVLLSLCACGGQTNNEPSENLENPTTEATETPTEEKVQVKTEYTPEELYGHIDQTKPNSDGVYKVRESMATDNGTFTEGMQYYGMPYN